MVDMASLRKRLSLEEGRRSKVYLDTRGIPTVGVGFNLQRGDARALLANVGADYDAVLAGRAELTDAQIDGLLDVTIAEAVAAARTLVNDFDAIPAAKQEVLVDMVFNMGVATVKCFTHMLAAIQTQDWPAAADAMQDSLWYKQVGRRAAVLCAEMREYVPGTGDQTTGTA